MLRPLGDRLVVELPKAEETTASGIILPDSAKERPQEGVILAIGKGLRDESGARIPLELKVGDRILYSKYTGAYVEREGNEYLILREDDVLAKLN